MKRDARVWVNCRCGWGGRRVWPTTKPCPHCGRFKVYERPRHYGRFGPMTHITVIVPIASLRILAVKSKWREAIRDAVIAAADVKHYLRRGRP